MQPKCPGISSEQRKVEVDQRPVNPLTLQAGGSIGFGKRWELMLEVGSNFDDAFVGVFSAAFRF